MDLNCCRICLERTDLLPLNTSYEFEEIGYKTIFELIFELSQIKITRDETLPQYVCSKCKYSLLAAYKLKNQIIETDLYLKQIFLTSNLDKQLQLQIQAEDKDTILTENEFQNYEKSLFSDEQLFDGILDDSMKFEIELEAPFDKPVEFKICEFCSKKIHENYIQEHMEFHEKNRNFTCSECHPPRIFPDQKKLRKHKFNSHNPKKSEKFLKCKNCSRYFLSKDKLQKHTAQIVMGMCKKTPSYEDRKCYVCLRDFSTISLKMKHLDIDHKDISKKCEKCNYQARAIKSYERHLRQHIHGVDYSCQVCNKVLRRRSDLQIHFKLQHSNFESQKYQCDLCGSLLRQRIHILRHMKTIHLNQRKFKCQTCVEVRDFTTQGALTQHLIDRHSYDTPYRCSDCKQGFAFNSQLVNHNKQKKVGEPCEKKFSKQTKGRKVLYCEKCKKFFKTYVGLNRHKLIHEGIKKYSCEICLKCFGQKSILEIHRRTHTGEKPFSCTYKNCTRTFNDPSSLYKHKISAHPEMLVHECSECLKKFPDSKTLTNHKKKLHTVKK